MGCNSSTADIRKFYVMDTDQSSSAIDGAGETSFSIREWKYFLSIEDATKKYLEDGSLPDNYDVNHVELRAILDDPLSQKVFGEYLKETFSLNVFSCWIAIQEYKFIPAADFRRSTARHLFNKFIKHGAVLQVAFLTDEDVSDIKNIVYSSFGNEMSSLNATVFNSIQIRCFEELYSNVFIPFKASSAYRELTQKIKKRYNGVAVNDFEYYEKLGEGGFGVVVHCKKKSTQKHYAMKILHKLSLLEYYSDDPSIVTFEKLAFSTLQHPFIVNLDYAFQTPSLAILVLDLLTGDLSKQLRQCPGYRMDPLRVQFYAAEVLLALSYMHQMGLIYRDLKPSNILLSQDGHVQLVDLGCAMFKDMELVNSERELNDKVPLFHSHGQKSGKLTSSTKSKVTKATVTTGTTGSENMATSTTLTSSSVGENNHDAVFGTYVGTIGYIAPEIVLQKGNTETIQYSPSVDYWSLGITVYKLLTGKLPFTEERLGSLLSKYKSKEKSSDDSAIKRENAGSSTLQELTDTSSIIDDLTNTYAQTIREIDFPKYIPPTTVDFLTKLLHLDEKKRLGGENRGSAEIKMHPYFRGIDWELLEQKLVVPPNKAGEEAETTLDYDRFESITFDQCLEFMKKTDWNKHVPDEESQAHFNKWDFISHKTFKVEFGIANELEQFDKSFKVRQLLGDKNDSKSKKKSWFELDDS